ncbi:hypothetical protein C923_03162 [Plasmodium falciparum UGT5.1]|uniref:Leucine-rich repeat protein n=1 Tax=Plasmodium falciparum UGT5.1 TaxID=1237627 RepID=W7JMB9_PLAFA|nr:hypothetical protein C923_03162 [Plasmodium falciparum UGT5.1]
MIDSNYDVINKINILNVQNANDIIKALCFYMDNVQISDILKKNTKPIRKKDTNIQKNNKTSLKKKETKPNNNAQEEKNNDIIKKNTCNIKSLNLFNSNIDINGIIFLSKSLYDNKYSKLENLSIDCISMDMDCIKYLSLSLCNYNNLKTLSLQYCNLNDDSIKYIIDIVIYLNFIDDNNLSKINEAMNFNKSISILKLPNE